MNTPEPMDIDEDETMDIDTLFAEPDDRRRDFIFIDVVGFHNRHHFICKEFYLTDGCYEYHAIIKPPYSVNKLPRDEREMVFWEISHLHGLQYQSGDMHLIEVIQATYPRLMGKTVIVENSFKARALQHIYRNCGDLNVLPITKMDFDMELQCKEEYPICENHSEILGQIGCECAIATAHRLKEITTNNLELLKILAK